MVCKSEGELTDLPMRGKTHDLIEDLKSLEDVLYNQGGNVHLACMRRLSCIVLSSDRPKLRAWTTRMPLDLLEPQPELFQVKLEKCLTRVANSLAVINMEGSPPWASSTRRSVNSSTSWALTLKPNSSQTCSMVA